MLRRSEVRHAVAVFLRCTTCVLVVAGGNLLIEENASAQDTNARRTTIRGFEFDPLELETARGGELEDELANIGIDEDLRARDPDRSDVVHWRFLQFSRPLDRDTRQELRSMGLELQKPVDGLYLERVSLDVVEVLRDNLGILRASIPYHPAFKLPPSLRGDGLLENREYRTERRREMEGLWLKAELFPGTDPTEIVETIEGFGGLDVFTEESRRAAGPVRIVFRLEGSPDLQRLALSEIANIDDIRSIEEVGELLLDNAKAAGVNQSGDSANPTIWNQGLAGKGQAISIFGSGIADTDHCFLADPGVAGNTPGTAHRKILEIRDKSGIYIDGSDHATSVAAIAAGVDFHPNGAHDGQRGGAWAAKLVLVNLWDFYELDPHTPPPSTLMDELLAVSDRTKIYSNSWRDASSEGYSSYAEVFDEFARMHEDVLVIASAGKKDAKWNPPAISKNVLTVSAATLDATQISDGYDDHPDSDQRKPDLAASACAIESASAGTTCGIKSHSCATSYAAPQAAAIAALARQYYVDGAHGGESRRPTGTLLKATLINSAQDVTGETGFPSVREGWGVVRLDRTLSFLGGERELWVRDVRNTDDDALDNGMDHDYYFEVHDSAQPLKVTLVWTDPPGALGNGDLQNDLDLEVTTPEGGTTFLGNHFDVLAGESTPGGSPDDKNNVEQVLVSSPPVGTWKIIVKVGQAGIATVEPGLTGQGFALVATAAAPATTNASTAEPDPPSEFGVN